MATTHQADTQVKLSGLHLCCEGCTGSVEEAVASVPGASVQCDMDEGSAVVKGRDSHSIQQAIDAIAMAGFYGESDNENFAVKDDPSLPQGRVKKATISDIHNCCDICYDEAKKGIHATPGVAADTGSPGATQYEVTGDFSPRELVKNLHKVGFHARVTV